MRKPTPTLGLDGLVTPFGSIVVTLTTLMTTKALPKWPLVGDKVVACVLENAVMTREGLDPRVW